MSQNPIIFLQVSKMRQSELEVKKWPRQPATATILHAAFKPYTLQKLSTYRIAFKLRLGH